MAKNKAVRRTPDRRAALIDLGRSIGERIVEAKNSEERTIVIAAMRNVTESVAREEKIQSSYDYMEGSE